MVKFFYGSFEKVLRTYITPNITQENLANTLLLSPRIDRKKYREAKDAIRASDYIDKGNVSKICKGTRKIPQALLDDHLKSNALENIEYSFLTEIVPRIPLNSRANIKEEIASLICQDESISEEEKSYYKEIAVKKELCIFLVETYMFAVTGISEPMKALLKPMHTNLPPQNRFFCGRKESLDTIRAQYKAGLYMQGLYGMRGVGKTQIALQYAHTYLKDYRLIWWMDAENRLTLQNGAVSFLRLQGYPVEDKNVEDIRRLFVDYFNRHRDWLLIYDNAEYGMPDEYEALLSYFPENVSQGNILLTTCCRNAFEDAVHMEALVFGKEEALSFLQNRSDIDDKNNAGKLAAQMGYLPLALEYAAAYIRETPGMDYTAYSKKLEQFGIKVLDYRVGYRAYKQTVREAFHITLDKILEDSAINPMSKSAEQFLNICAFLASEEIDVRIFFHYGKGLPDPVRLVLGNELECDALVRTLTKYSLVRANGNTLSIHQLLQEVMYDEIKPEDAMLCANYAYGVFYNVFYSMRKLPVESVRPLLAASVPHVQAILRRYVQLYRHHEQEIPDSIMVAKEYFSWTGLLLTDNKQLSSSELSENCRKEIPILETSVDFYSMIPGEKTIYPAYTLMLLAQSYIVLGEIQPAFEHYSKALQMIDEVISGLPEHVEPSQPNAVLNLYRTEVFQLASDICASIASSSIIYTDSALLWSNYRSLTKILLKQLACFPHKEEAENYRGTWLTLWIFSQQISNYTKRSFVVHLDVPAQWRCERKNPFLAGAFGFFRPTEEIDSEPSASVLEGFDIILNDPEIPMELSGNWITLAFAEGARTLEGMMDTLLKLGIDGITTDAKHLLYSAIYSLAINMGREDIMVLYEKKLQE